MARGVPGSGESSTMAVQLERALVARIDEQIKAKAADMTALGITFTDRQLAGARKQFVEKAANEALNGGAEDAE